MYTPQKNSNDGKVATGLIWIDQRRILVRQRGNVVELIRVRARQCPQATLHGRAQDKSQIRKNSLREFDHIDHIFSRVSFARSTASSDVRKAGIGYRNLEHGRDAAWYLSGITLMISEVSHL